MGQETGEQTKERAEWTKPHASMQAEIGIDSLQRRFYQPGDSRSIGAGAPERQPGTRPATSRYLAAINGSQQVRSILGPRGLERGSRERFSFEQSR